MKKESLEEFFARQQARLQEKLDRGEERLALRLQEMRQDRKSRLEDTLAGDGCEFESRGHARGRKKPSLAEKEGERE